MYCKEQTSYFKEYLMQKNNGDNIKRLSSSLYESKISLNPHQITAALSFFKNPQKKGLIFADEVGLGKTIEAGLVISQYWYEKKDKILIICPASLIKQWNEELFDKFQLDSTIVDTKLIQQNGFDWNSGIYITSYNYVYLNKGTFHTQFDLIVIDEAHKLRNIYKSKSIIASSIKDVFIGQKKLLLTATPFQNNLLELFGLISFIDENIFPDLKVFKEKYVNNYSEHKNDLKAIISNYMIRTLRKDVTKYINYTKREVLLTEYITTLPEQNVYNNIIKLMYSNNFLGSYSSGQNQLIIILLQKLMSSSLYAIKSTLTNMKSSLDGNFSNSIFSDEEDIILEHNNDNKDAQKNLSLNIDAVIKEIENLPIDSKWESLKKTLTTVFSDLDLDSKRNHKVLIFTESKKTQEYLYKKISDLQTFNTLLFNGENKDEKSQEIYSEWLAKQHSVQGNKNINIRKAIVDAFQNKYDIMIATDAAAEGLNMQFCSVLINYDLPWNPQKIEQRIGRCHRYGQQNDVIVVNILNASNTIDKRIYELLNYKLGIFEDTFGTSDIILGTTDIADDIENSIKKIYKSFRTHHEIEEAFKDLQTHFKDEIEVALKKSENYLEEYFDEEISKAFDLKYIEAKKIVNEYEDIFYLLLKSVFTDLTFNDTDYSFKYKDVFYTVDNKNPNFHFCSLKSDIGQKAIQYAENLSFGQCNAYNFEYSSSHTNIGFINDHIGKNGKLIISKIICTSYEMSEQIVTTSILEDGTEVPFDVTHKMLKLSTVPSVIKFPNINIKQQHDNNIKQSIITLEEYRATIFKEEIDYIDNWADTMIEKIQLDVSNLREEKKELQIQFDFATNLQEQTKLQELIHSTSKKINKLWIELAGAEDEIEEKRYNLIKKLKAEKNKEIQTVQLFELNYTII